MVRSKKLPWSLLVVGIIVLIGAIV